MDIARTVPDQALGLHPDRTVDDLKKRLGVTHLELVVLSNVDEYRGLLVEKEPPHTTRRVVLATALLVLVAYTMVAMLVHPGVRLDHLLGHLHVEVH